MQTWRFSPVRARVTLGGRRSRGCPCDHQVCSWVPEQRTGTLQLPRWGCSSHPSCAQPLPQTKTLASATPSLKQCLQHSESESTVWELLLLPACSCQQRDYTNPLSWGVKQGEAALRAKLLPLYHSIDPQAKSVTRKEILFHLPNNSLNI